KRGARVVGIAAFRLHNSARVPWLVARIVPQIADLESQLVDLPGSGYRPAAPIADSARDSEDAFTARANGQVDQARGPGAGTVDRAMEVAAQRHLERIRRPVACHPDRKDFLARGVVLGCRFRGALGRRGSNTQRAAEHENDGKDSPRIGLRLEALANRRQLPAS